MKIAVDFDGTIVEHRYPQIGKEIPFAIDTLKMLQQEGHWLILWSVREGKLLEEAALLQSVQGGLSRRACHPIAIIRKTTLPKVTAPVS